MIARIEVEEEFCTLSRWHVTDFGCDTLRILDADGAGSGVADLQGGWWFCAEKLCLFVYGM